MKEVDDFIEVYNQYLDAIRMDYPDIKLIKRKDVNTMKEVYDDIFYFLTAFDFPKTYYDGFSFVIEETEGLDRLIPLLFMMDIIYLMFTIRMMKVYIYGMQSMEKLHGHAGKVFLLFLRQ